MNRRCVTLFFQPSPSQGISLRRSRIDVSILEFMFDTNPHAH